MDIIPLRHAHITDALALCGQVNWNHLAADWQRSIDLNPEGCLGGFIDGRLRATCTLNCFGDLGWVGTFLVDEALRGQGQGKAMFAGMIAQAKRLELAWLGLDSTDAGRPIYRQHGFVEDEGIERWSGPNPGGDAAGTEPLNDALWPALQVFDHASVGLDRATQLRHLAAEEGAVGRVLRRNGALVGFGLSRRGRLSGSIGPLVAEDEDAARRLLAALCADRRHLDGEQGIALDALDHDPFKAHLTGLGLVMRRRLIRMFRPGRQRRVFTGPAVWCATGLGMG